MIVRRIIIAFVAATVVFLAVWGSVLTALMHRAPEEGRGRVVRLTVERGETFLSIARRLEHEGVVESAWAMRAWAALRRVDRRVQSGTYQFTVGERPVDILDRLVAGDILKVAVTIPEGYTQWEIAKAFAAAGVDSTAMVAAIRDSVALAQRHIPAPSLEGYLFPDTYHVPYGAHPADIVHMMMARLDEVFDHDMIARAVKIGMTPHQVLTLASIIEAETRVPEERPVVSAVYHNRLARGMKLEADPTVAYAMGGYRGRLFFADLNIDSPYNTYRHAGLPPGPICSPGAASIHAALYPDPDTKALYFVARGDGSHIFSLTLREHLAAVRRVRRAQNEQHDANSTVGR